MDDKKLHVDSEIPMPESHKGELDRRREQHIQDPGDLLTLDQLQARIERRKCNDKTA